MSMLNLEDIAQEGAFQSKPVVSTKYPNDIGLLTKALPIMPVLLNLF